jgi:branched-chain amino acid transport system substrate-binding protein
MRVALTLVTLLLAALSAGVWSAGAQAPPIRIGFASAMSGPAAITGEGVRWGATLAVEEINAKGGVMGRKLEAFFADNKAQPGEAVSAVRKLADVDQVDVIIGQTHSGACLGAMPVVKELGVPMVIEACSHPQIRALSGKGGNEWTFRVALDDEIMAYTFARYMARQGVKSSSILAMNNDFGRGAANAYDGAFKKAGIKLLSTEFFDPGQPDYRPVLTRLKRANPETILAVILASDGAPFMRQFRELGLTQRVFSRGSLGSAEFLHQVRDNPKVGDGVIEASYWITGLDPEVDRALQGAAPHPRQPGGHHAQVGGGAGARDRAEKARQGRSPDDPRGAGGGRRQGLTARADQVRRESPGLDQHDPDRDA